jgi:hypothetical protein
LLAQASTVSRQDRKSGCDDLILRFANFHLPNSLQQDRWSRHFEDIHKFLIPSGNLVCGGFA